MARFVIISGSDVGKVFELSGPEVIIGRQTGAQIQLEGQKVSRNHARVVRQGDDFCIEDLHSANGTLLNGKRLQTSAPLRLHDEIGIGSYVIRFDNGDAPPDYTIKARTVANTANAELFRGDAARKLQVILQMSSDLGRFLETDQLLPQILEHLFALFPQAERGLVVLLEPEGPVVRAIKHRGRVDKAGFSVSIVGHVTSEGVGILAEDLPADSRFAEAQSVLSLGIRSLICAPLRTKSGKSIGVLQLDRAAHQNGFTPDDLNLLTAVGLQSSVALENAQLHQELIARQRIENEISVAREIQLSYLPTEVPEFRHKNFEVHAELHPANEISGDFYDYFRIGEDRLALAVADVCGKGIPAALFMSMVRALLRSLAEKEEDPAILLRDLNNAVAQQNPKGQFVTLSFCVFDPGACAIDISSAGHPSPLIRRASGSVETLEVQHGPVLGFMERSEPYPKARCEIHPGELFLLYTDGVTEAPGANDKMFGPERLRASLEEREFPSQLTQWTQSLRKSIETFTGSRSQEDDITLALLRVL
jgi:serine phosphatase RsbU (regulator of sigma subunit)